MNKQQHVLLLAVVTLPLGCNGNLHTGVTVGPIHDPDASADTIPPEAPPTNVKPTYVIDDMEREDGASHFISPARVLGLWGAGANYAIGRTPLPGAEPIVRPVSVARGASLRAATMRGGPLEDGADLFIELHPLPPSQANFNFVDFSAYTGIAFWARSATPEQNLVVAAKDDQIPVDNEEFWKAEFDDQHPWFAIVQTLSDRWQRYEIRFSQLRQGVTFGGPRTTRSLHAGALNSIHFIIGVGSQPFELWIDDLVLTCDSGCGDSAADGGVPGSDGR